MSALNIAALLILVATLATILIRNHLVALNNRLIRAESAIDIVLEQRFDTIPNLVAVVKGYVKHERETLEAMTALRAFVSDRELSRRERVDCDHALSEQLARIMVAVEAYPNLKASENFLQLQRAINEVEERLAAARRNYNAAVLAYNNGIQIFPHNMLASLLGYTKAASFVTSDFERAKPDIGELQRG